MQERTPTTAGWRLNRYLTAPLLPPWLNGIFVAALAVGVAVLLWERRGPLVAILALAFYGAGAAFVVRGPARLTTWSREHPVVDSLLLIPLLVFALLLATQVPAWLCVAASVGIGLVVASWTAQGRRRRQQFPTDGRLSD